MMWFSLRKPDKRWLAARVAEYHKAIQEPYITNKRLQLDLERMADPISASEPMAWYLDQLGDS